jgi:PAS domain S-box-containing protein
MAWSRDVFFLAAVESSLDCVKVLDLKGRLRFINAAGRSLLELDDFETVRDKPWAELWPKSAGDWIAEALTAARDGRTTEVRDECPTARGALKTWQVSVSPLRDPAGHVCAIFVVSRDISASILRERELVRTAAALRSANRIARVGGWELDCVTSEVHLSSEMCALLGLGEAQSMSRAQAEAFWLDEDHAAFQLAVTEAMAANSRIEFEGRVNTPSGVRWMRLLGEPEIVDGSCVALRGAVQDITESREALERLRASEERAQAAAQTMSSFLATMSHEIRTPLNGIIGMAEAIARGELPGVQRERIGVVQQSGQILLTLLNDLLDLSRIQEGQLKLEPGVISCGELARSAETTFEALVRDKDVHFSLHASPPAEACWAGDPTRIRQVVTNLVSNAVKFTSRGAVACTLDHDGENLVLVVEDTGAGIPAERLGCIFDRFVQADASTTRKYGGSGLGLAICRELARLMGGDITVESELGRGSRFIMTVPAAPAAGSARQSPEAASPSAPTTLPGRPLRILAAEDNATNRLVLATLLDELGLSVTLVEDGAAAVQACREHAWDVVLMDIQMPVMDGLTAARCIRQEEGRVGRARTPILALTANAMDHQAVEYRLAGMDGMVAKPISVAGLVQGLQSVLAEAAPDQAAA